MTNDEGRMTKGRQDKRHKMKDTRGMAADDKQLSTSNNQLPTAKTCVACGNSFDCNAADIVNCQCYSVKIPAHVMPLVKEKYNDCLCANCLRQIIRQEGSGQEHL